MAERSSNENINKKDLDLILEVNKKAIEIETAVADQNEEVLSLLSKIKENQDKIDYKLDKINKHSEDLSKDIFKIQVLFISGLLSLVIQVLQMFKK